MTTLEKAGLLAILPKMTGRIDAIQCAGSFNAIYKTELDWHEFAYYLDELRRKGILIQVGKRAGFEQYQLNKGS